MSPLSKNGLTKALTRMTKKENDQAKPFCYKSIAAKAEFEFLYDKPYGDWQNARLTPIK